MSEERKFTTTMGKLAGIEELNNRFSWFLGEEEPNPTYPFMLWAKPSTDAIYMRRATNDAWIKIANLSGVVEQLKTHTHTKSQITDFPTSMPANGGNADTVDGVHAYIVTASDTILLSATAERQTNSNNENEVVLKGFRLSYPGYYRISFQYRGNGGNLSDYTPRISADLLIKNGQKLYNMLVNLDLTSSSYATYTADFLVPYYDMEVKITGKSKHIISGMHNTALVRNAYIKGTVSSITASPSVLQD